MTEPISKPKPPRLKRIFAWLGVVVALYVISFGPVAFILGAFQVKDSSTTGNVVIVIWAPHFLAGQQFEGYKRYTIWWYEAGESVHHSLFPEPEIMDGGELSINTGS